MLSRDIGRYLSASLGSFPGYSIAITFVFLQISGIVFAIMILEKKRDSQVCALGPKFFQNFGEHGHNLEQCQLSYSAVTGKFRPQ